MEILRPENGATQWLKHHDELLESKVLDAQVLGLRPIVGNDNITVCEDQL